MEGQIDNHIKGLRILIIFYAFVIVQNILGWKQFGGSTLLVSVISGTIVYMTIGLIRKKAASWFIAVIFHIFYQLMITLSFVALQDATALQELYKMIPAESVPAAKTIMLAAFCLLTAANVYAIAYLFRNRKVFISAIDQR